MAVSRSILRGAFLFLILQTLSSCSSYTDETRSIRSKFRSQAYQKALEDLESSSIKPNGRHRLLYHLEKAMILEELGERSKSRKHLLEADRIVDELYTVSLSKEAMTLLYNDSAQDYPGEDYEKVAIHTHLALSFLRDRDLASARVEARKINSRLNEINSKYEKKNRYVVDAFGRYLGGLIYEARGEWDSAIVDYRLALKEYEGRYNELFDTAVPQSLVSSLYQLYLRRGRRSEARQLEKNYPWLESGDWRQYGELAVIHPVGEIAVKQRFEYLIGVGRQAVRLSFPIIRPSRFASFPKTGFKVDGLNFTKGELSQNLDKIAALTLEDRRLRLILKAGSRLIMKGQLTQKAEKQGGPLVGLLVNIYGAVSETADTRQWTLLPSHYYISRHRLPVGTHKVNIYGDGRLTQIETVNIKAGGLSLLVQD